jgi:hypothetical protein
MSAPPTLRVAVVLERLKQPTRWEDWRHTVVDVVPDDGSGLAEPQVLAEDGRVTRMLFPGLAVTLHRDEGEGYWLNLGSAQPVWFVMWRVDDADPSRAWPERVTLSYNEAGRLLDAQERVDNVPLPPEVCEWLQSWTDATYKPEPKERKRPASFRSPERR